MYLYIYHVRLFSWSLWIEVTSVLLHPTYFSTVRVWLIPFSHIWLSGTPCEETIFSVSVFIFDKVDFCCVSTFLLWHSCCQSYLITSYHLFIIFQSSVCSFFSYFDIMFPSHNFYLLYIHFYDLHTFLWMFPQNIHTCTRIAIYTCLGQSKNVSHNTDNSISLRIESSCLQRGAPPWQKGRYEVLLWWDFRP